MATIKAYTDLEQSKKLAEILPLESADICYVCGNTILNLHTKYGDTSIEELYKKHIIPAWSLAALLNILPSATLDSSDDHHYRVHCNERFTEWYDNAIDACVAMIEKLHELNLL